MNNREKILKYLSDLMNRDEKREFESLLENDSELQEEFNSIKKSLATLKRDSEPEVNETYFVNLLPRARSKMEKKKKGIAFGMKLVPPFAALIFLIVSTMFFSRSFEDQFFTFNEIQSLLSANNLTAADKAKLDLVIEENYYDFVNVTNTEGNDLENELSTVNLQPEEIEQVEISDIPAEEDYQYIDNISQKDFNKIYEAIKKIKLQ